MVLIALILLITVPSFITHHLHKTLSGVIAGTGTLTKNGSSTLTLSGANTYTGTTTISAGTLEVDGTLAQTAVTVASGATYDVDATDTVLSIAGAGTIDLTDAALTAGDGNDLEFSGVFNGANTFTKVGSGTLTLSGDNSTASYTGRIIIDAGTISISSDSNLGSPNTLDADRLTLQGGTLQTTASFTLNTNRGITLSTDGGTINTNTGTTLTYGGVITGSTAFTKSGAGTLVLTATNTFTGNITISAGTLKIDGTGTLESGNYDGTISNAGTLHYSSTTDQTLGGAISSTGALTKDETSTLTLSADNTYSGTTTISAGTLTVSGTLSDSTDVDNSGIYDVDATDTIQSLTGSGAVQIASGQTLTTGDSGDDEISGIISGAGKFN